MTLQPATVCALTVHHWLLIYEWLVCQPLAALVEGGTFKRWSL